MLAIIFAITMFFFFYTTMYMRMYDLYVYTVPEIKPLGIGLLLSLLLGFKVHTRAVPVVISNGLRAAPARR